jgi:GNAT superfamily N-acetyltransferase
VLIRALRQTDLARVVGALAAIDRPRSPELYSRYLAEQAAGARIVWLAEDGPFFLGHVCVVWSSGYEPFRVEGIPEIADLIVMPAHRRHGIGSQLIEVAENSIVERADLAGIAVGLYADYGHALRLYLRRGYRPDGRGIAYGGRTVPPGECIRVDDRATLQLVKLLR